MLEALVKTPLYFLNLLVSTNIVAQKGKPIELIIILCHSYKWFLERKKNNELLAPFSEERASGEWDYSGFYPVLMDKSLEKADDKHSETSSQNSYAVVILYLPCLENTWNSFSDYTADLEWDLQWLNIDNKYYRELLITRFIIKYIHSQGKTDLTMWGKAQERIKRVDITDLYLFSLLIILFK